MDSLQWTVSSGQCPVSSFQWIVYSGQSAVDNLQWVVFSGQSPVDSIQWTVSSGQSPVDRLQWTGVWLTDVVGLQWTVSSGQPDNPANEGEQPEGQPEGARAWERPQMKGLRRGGSTFGIYSKHFNILCFIVGLYNLHVVRSESARALYVPLGQYIWQSRTTTIITFIVELQISPSQTID